MTMTAAMRQPSGRFITQVADSFGKACDSYVSAARLQQQVALDALALLPASPRGHLLDLGCGPGWIHPNFSAYSAGFTAIDLSEGMLAKAAQQQLARGYIQADAAALPLADGSVDKVFSSLMLQWSPMPEAVFAEVGRVLTPGGRAVITTLVDGTLAELKQAFASIDTQQHVNAFLTKQQIAAAAQAASCMQWQYQIRSYPLYYPDVRSLARELKALGANQVAGRTSQGLTGKGYWQQLANAYEVNRSEFGLPASYQVLIITGCKNAH